MKPANAEKFPMFFSGSDIDPANTLAVLERAYDHIIQLLNYGDFGRYVELDAGYLIDAIEREKEKK